MNNLIGFLSALIVCLPFSNTQGTTRGLTEAADAENKALVIGVSHGLPGIDLDVANVEKMVKVPAYNFASTRMMDGQATVAAALAKTTALASQVDHRGTFFWYFSGHGGNQILSFQDTVMNVKQLRKAIEEGRKLTGPLERLVLMFDSCYSGSLLDSLRRAGFSMEINISSESMVDTITREMAPTRDSSYWNKLFVFASSRADETSNATANGSAFTVGLAKAFEESMASNETIGTFIQKTQNYTIGHHPVARLAPEDLRNEKMKP